MNGCICCTVRGDLVKVLKRLRSKLDNIDGVIIETTGLADPAPVAQTFFVDDDIQKSYKLDGIITVVDAKHITEHLEEEKPEGRVVFFGPKLDWNSRYSYVCGFIKVLKVCIDLLLGIVDHQSCFGFHQGVENESVEQIAFADRIILNKTDLVDDVKLGEVEAKVKKINGAVEIIRAQYSKAWDVNEEQSPKNNDVTNKQTSKQTSKQASKQTNKQTNKLPNVG